MAATVNYSLDATCPDPAPINTFNAGIVSVRTRIGLQNTNEIYWPQSVPWSAIVAQFNANPSVINAVHLVDDNSSGVGSPAITGDWVINTPANLDNVYFIGIGSNYGNKVVEITSGFSHTGSQGTIRGRDITFAPTGTITAPTAQRLFINLINGVIDNSWTGTATTPFFAVVAGHVTNVTIQGPNGYICGGGAGFDATVPLFTIPNGGGGNLSIRTQAGSFIADFVANMVSGTATVTVFEDAISATLQPDAFGVGITVVKEPWGDAFFAQYAPTTPGSWTPPPTNVGKALDQLAGRSTGGASLADIWWSPADAANTSGIGGITANGNFTSGAKYQFTRSVTFTAVKFFWNGAAGLTIKCSVWDSTGARVASGTVVTTGSGLHTCTMTVPYTLPITQLYKDVTVGMWETTGAKYQTLTVTGLHFPDVGQQRFNMMIGPSVQLFAFNFFQAGDAMPNTGGPDANAEYYPVSPVFTVP